MTTFATWTHLDRGYRDLLAHLRGQLDGRPWLAFFCQEDPARIQCGALNATCRLEPVPFDDAKVDRLFFTSQPEGRGELLGGALTMRMVWDGRPESLPRGWQGVVRRSYRDGIADEDRRNTLVGMQLFTVSHLRKEGLSGQFMEAMLALARSEGYPHCVVPALSPTQFMREHVETPFDELAKALREDGLPLDHWTRLHVRKGARVVGHCSRSHRFALSLADFAEHISSDALPSTGYHVVRLNKDVSFGMNAARTYQRVWADLEHDLVTFDWGCVWVHYDLATLPG